MSTPVLSMMIHCDRSSSASTKLSTLKSLQNHFNPSKKTKNEIAKRLCNVSFLFPSTILFPQLTCSISMPILFSENENDHSIHSTKLSSSTSTMTAKKNVTKFDSLTSQLNGLRTNPEMASSLPNICLFQQQQSRSPVEKRRSLIRSDTIDLAKQIQIKSDLESLKMMIQSDSIDGLSDTLSREEKSIAPNLSASSPTPSPRRRKNSQMSPIKPDLELMSRIDSEEQKSNEKKEECDNGQSKNSTSETIEACDATKEDRIFSLDLESEDENLKESNNRLESMNDRIKGFRIENRNTQISQSTQSSGNEKNQSAAAWLAAATHQLSCLNSHHISKQKSIQQSNQNQNRFQKQTKSLDDYDEEQRSKEESFLQKDQRHQRVRRTSILRRQPSFSNEKKNVRFADSIGLKLENILYFQPPSTPVRRFTSPANSNSEWNAQTWHGILCDRFVAPTCDLNRSNKSDSNNRDGEEIHKNLDKAKQQAFDSLDSQQRYELVMSNFSNPSERFDFTQVLCEKNVLLHSITISETTIYGIVSCLNIHFIKKVYVRYTFDDWSTQIEREANYMLGSHDGRTDKFSFCIYSQPKDFKIFDGTENDMIASERNKSSSEEDMSDGSDDKENRPQMIDSKRCPRIYFAIRFRSGDGQEFWDNNHGQNYRLDLKRLS